MYDLLNENYVENDDNMFRFDYSINFLRWALTPPHFKTAWHLGVRRDREGAKTLVGFITAIPTLASVYKKYVSISSLSLPLSTCSLVVLTPLVCRREVKSVEINFLCVHKNLRTKRLAPVLIREITRRVNVTDTWQAVYTAGVMIPTPVTSCQYYHRSLDPKKLISIGFSHKRRNMSMALTQKFYRLPVVRLCHAHTLSLSTYTHLHILTSYVQDPQIKGIRQMKKADIPQAYPLLMKYLSQFHLYSKFTPEEFEHWCVLSLTSRLCAHSSRTQSHVYAHLTGSCRARVWWTRM